jgi:hypothetical protein
MENSVLGHQSNGIPAGKSLQRKYADFWLSGWADPRILGRVCLFLLAFRGRIVTIRKEGKFSIATL